MTNREKLDELNPLLLSMFICIYAENIYRKYSTSVFGFALWLQEPVDNVFWNEFYKRIDKGELKSIY